MASPGRLATEAGSVVPVVPVVPASGSDRPGAGPWGLASLPPWFCHERGTTRRLPRLFRFDGFAGEHRMSYWTVVRTTSFRENAVADQLRRAGFPVYLPRTQERARDQLRTVPLFPCYLFAQVVERWAPIVATVGVVRLLRAGDGPARLPDYVIDELHKREVDGIVRLPPLRRGQAVRIVRGSLKGQFAIYQGMSGRDREHVLLSFLGREVHAEIRAGDAVAHH